VKPFWILFALSALAPRSDAAAVVVSEGVREILEKNPQLRDVPEFPPIAIDGETHALQGDLIKRIYVAACPFPMDIPARRSRGRTFDPGILVPIDPPPPAPKGTSCLFVVFRASLDPAACRYAVERRFFVELTADGTRALKAFAFNGEYGERSRHCRMAKFDDTGQIAWRRTTPLDESEPNMSEACYALRSVTAPPKARVCEDGRAEATRPAERTP